MKTNLLNIIRGHWALQKDWVAANAIGIAALLRGEMPDTELMGSKTNLPLGINVIGSLYQVDYYTDITKLQSGTVAMINIIGPIVKYGGLCSYGSMDYVELVSRLSASQNVVGIVFNIDSPGGMVAGTSALAKAIADCPKRTVGFINDGYAASAGMWIAAACDEIYCAHDTDSVGSIGVFCTLQDVNKYFESLGLPIHEIYAPQSVDKNKDVKEALAGNYKLIQEELKVLAASFVTSVKAGRGDRLTSDDWQGGAMYFAPQAQKIGLIDGVRSLAEITQMIEANEYPDTTTALKSHNNMFGNKFPKVSSLKGRATDDISEEDITAANEELHAAGIDKDITLQSASYTQGLQASTKKASEELTAAKSFLTTAQTRITQLEGDLAAEKKKPGGSFTSPVAENKGDNFETDEDEAKMLAGLSHNKMAADLD